jgi:battenin
MHVKRIFVNSIIIICAYIIIAFAATFNEDKASFFIALVSSILFGVGSALGESTTLGFCKGFPSNLVGFFGSGTGFAGIFGSGILLILKGVGLDNGPIFFIVGPSVIPYFLAFYWLHLQKKRHVYYPDEKTPLDSDDISDQLTQNENEGDLNKTGNNYDSMAENQM